MPKSSHAVASPYDTMPPCSALIHPFLGYRTLACRLATLPSRTMRLCVPSSSSQLVSRASCQMRCFRCRGPSGTSLGLEDLADHVDGEGSCPAVSFEPGSSRKSRHTQVQHEGSGGDLLDGEGGLGLHGADLLLRLLRRRDCELVSPWSYPIAGRATYILQTS